MDEYYNSYGVNIKRGDYDLSFKADNEYENVRSLVKDLLKRLIPMK
jgi:selenocysteine lyase/cysteine desulfurase